jgi:hypothetical protein
MPRANSRAPLGRASRMRRKRQPCRRKAWTFVSFPLKNLYSGLSALYGHVSENKRTRVRLTSVGRQAHRPRGIFVALRFQGESMAIRNLELYRSGESVWDRTRHRWNWDTERWLIAAAAVGVLAEGLRRRSQTGLALILSSGALAWWAFSEIGQRRHRRGHLKAVVPMPQRDDPVIESSEESFPASDAPSWTSTTGHATTPR